MNDRGLVAEVWFDALRLTSFAQGIRLGLGSQTWLAMSEVSARAETESNGRRGWTRTTDLLRVREAL
jgi:hypothetical protein